MIVFFNTKHIDEEHESNAWNDTNKGIIKKVIQIPSSNNPNIESRYLILFHTILSYAFQNHTIFHADLQQQAGKKVTAR